MGPDDVAIEDGDTTWRFDRAFLTSHWTCLWGRGCLGILPQPAEHLGHGCCSLGADLDGVDEARRISALAATLEPDVFQYHDAAQEGGIFSDATRTSTRVVDGACVFLNRPGFPGGAGCALHLTALAAGESPIDWKPSVCWQLPIKVDWVDDGGGAETAVVRGWTRDDWGDDGAVMAWCCTEGARAYVGDRPVMESLQPELEAIIGPTVYVELRRRLASPGPGSSPRGPETVEWERRVRSPKSHDQAKRELQLAVPMQLFACIPWAQPSAPSVTPASLRRPRTSDATRTN